MRLSASNLPSSEFQFLKSVDIVCNVVASHLSTLDFKVGKSTSDANADLSRSVAFLRSILLQTERSNYSTFTFQPKRLYGLVKYLLTIVIFICCTIAFALIQLFNELS